MAFTGTSLLSLPIITTGTESGAWGNITNNGLTQYLDTAIAGALSITSSITLANTSGDASGTNLASTTAQYRTLVVPASGPSANIVITAPSSNRTYHVVNRNATYTVQIRAGANSGVTLGVNQSATVTYNSTSADYELVGVVGASTATDNAIARFDGTTGKIVQNSVVTIADSTGDIAGVGSITVGAGAAGTPSITTTGDTNTGIYFPAADTIAFTEGGVEAMRITSSGNVGIGATTGLDRLTVRLDQNTSTRIAINNQDAGSSAESVLRMSSSGATWDIGTGSAAKNSNALTFGVIGSEYMRINSSGYLLVGYTSSNGAYRLQVNSQIFATSSTIATSDGRYKKDIEPLDGALDLVKNLNPVQFSWKQHPVHAFDTATPTVGFIAQEVQQTLADKPYLNSIIKANECVIEPEEKDENGNIIKEAVKEEFLGIAEGNMIALLTKAIQEQQALIESLTARVAQLEGNQA